MRVKSRENSDVWTSESFTHGATLDDKGWSMDSLMEEFRTCSDGHCTCEALRHTRRKYQIYTVEMSKSVYAYCQIQDEWPRKAGTCADPCENNVDPHIGAAWIHIKTYGEIDAALSSHFLLHPPLWLALNCSLCSAPRRSTEAQSLYWTSSCKLRIPEKHRDGIFLQILLWTPWWATRVSQSSGYPLQSLYCRLPAISSTIWKSTDSCQLRGRDEAHEPPCGDSFSPPIHNSHEGMRVSHSFQDFSRSYNHYPTYTKKYLVVDRVD